MFGYLKQRREPTQAEILINLTIIEIVSQPENFRFQWPTYSGDKIVMQGPEGLKLTCYSGLCGGNLRDFKLNGLKISKLQARKLWKLYSFCAKDAENKIAQRGNDERIGRLMKRRADRNAQLRLK